MKQSNNVAMMEKNAGMLPPTIPLILHTGPITPVVQQRIVTEIEQQVYLTEIKKDLIIHCCIELLQNIMHHGLKSFTSDSYFSVSISEEVSIITAVNGIEEFQKDKLNELLQHYSGFTPEECETLYKDLLLREMKPAECAGLGLLCIFRAAQKVEYTFGKKDNNQYNFSVRVTI